MQASWQGKSLETVRLRSLEVEQADRSGTFGTAGPRTPASAGPTRPTRLTSRQFTLRRTVCLGPLPDSRRLTHCAYCVDWHLIFRAAPTFAR